MSTVKRKGGFSAIRVSWPTLPLPGREGSDTPSTVTALSRAPLSTQGPNAWLLGLGVGQRFLGPWDKWGLVLVGQHLASCHLGLSRTQMCVHMGPCPQGPAPGVSVQGPL